MQLKINLFPQKKKKKAVGILIGIVYLYIALGSTAILTVQSVLKFPLWLGGNKSD